MALLLIVTYFHFEHTKLEIGLRTPTPLIQSISVSHQRNALAPLQVCLVTKYDSSSVPHTFTAHPGLYSIHFLATNR